MVMPIIQYAPETCAWCEGTGKYGNYNDLCLVCGGSGSVLVAQPPRQCPQCNGSGVFMAGEFPDRCKICGGAGWSHTFKGGGSTR